MIKFIIVINYIGLFFYIFYIFLFSFIFYMLWIYIFKMILKGVFFKSNLFIFFIVIGVVKCFYFWFVMGDI